MPYKETWGEKAQERSKRRLEYFKKYRKNHYKKRFNGFGSKGELIALKIFKDAILLRKSGFDLIWQNERIEVKISHFQKLGGGTSTSWGWAFHTRRQKGKTDYFLLICLNQKLIIEKIYFIPDNLIPNTLRVDINKNGKRFEKYKLRGGERNMSDDPKTPAEEAVVEETPVVETSNANAPAEEVPASEEESKEDNA